MICKHILLIGFFNEPKLILLRTVKWFQVLLCITNHSIKPQLFLYTQLNDQKVLFLTIQFSMITLDVKQFYLPIDRTLSGATTPGQSGPGSEDNEGALRILQSSSITGESLSNCLMSSRGHSFGEVGSHPSVEIQSVYSTAPARLSV